MEVRSRNLSDIRMYCKSRFGRLNEYLEAMAVCMV